MKHLLLTLFTMSMLCVGELLSAQNYAPDAHAEAYIATVGITDPVAIDDINLFVIGLKQLAAWDSLVYAADLRSHHNIGSGTTLYAIKGNTSNGQTGLSGMWSTNGLVFSGLVDNYVQFANPFSTTVSTNHTVMAAFACEQSTAIHTIVNGYTAANRGPWFGAGGGVGGVQDAYEIMQDFSANGAAFPTAVLGRYTDLSGNTGNPQFANWTLSPTYVSCAANIDQLAITTAAQVQATNTVANWRIGLTSDGFSRMKGTIAFVGVWSTNLSDAVYQNVRRLYTATLGRDYVPSTEYYFDGDRFVLGAENNRAFGEILLNDARWGGKFVKRTFATTNATPATVLAALPTTLSAWRNEARYSSKAVYALSVGGSDVNSRSAQAIYTDLQTIWATARAGGFKVMAMTILPDVNHTATGIDTRNGLNEMIKRSQGLWDYFVDLNPSGVLTIPALNANYNAGGDNLNATGQAYLANLIATKYPVP